MKTSGYIFLFIAVLGGKYVAVFNEEVYKIAPPIDMNANSLRQRISNLNKEGINTPEEEKALTALEEAEKADPASSISQ